MASERMWESTGPIAFIADGGADGTVTVESVSGLRVKQEVIITATSKPTLSKLEIKKVLSATKIIVGPINTKGEFLSRQDLSAYTVALSASIKVIEQKKSKPRPEDIISAVYEQEPVVGIRTYAVDELGRGYNQSNPVPIKFTEAITVADAVDLDLRFDRVSSTLMYLGEAPVGSLESEAKWKISLIEVIGTVTSIKWASTSFDKVWNDRAGLTYE